MFTSAQLRIVARLLYMALGYESREVRIRALLGTNDVQVALLATQLKFSGYLNPTGVEKAPK